MCTDKWTELVYRVHDWNISSFYGFQSTLCRKRTRPPSSMRTTFSDPSPQEGKVSGYRSLFGLGQEARLWYLCVGYETRIVEVCRCTVIVMSTTLFAETLLLPSPLSLRSLYLFLSPEAFLTIFFSCACYMRVHQSWILSVTFFTTKPIETSSKKDGMSGIKGCQALRGVVL